jgi:hypothetical protein
MKNSKDLFKAEKNLHLPPNPKSDIKENKHTEPKAA